MSASQNEALKGRWVRLPFREIIALIENSHMSFRSQRRVLSRHRTDASAYHSFDGKKYNVILYLSWKLVWAIARQDGGFVRKLLPKLSRRCESELFSCYEHRDKTRKWQAKLHKKISNYDSWHENGLRTWRRGRSRKKYIGSRLSQRTSDTRDCTQLGNLNMITTKQFFGTSSTRLSLRSTTYDNLRWSSVQHLRKTIRQIKTRTTSCS